MYELSGVYKPKVSALSQLIDLEEDMAKDGFDYSIFVAKEVNHGADAALLYPPMTQKNELRYINCFSVKFFCLLYM